jgi:RHS repeat-associated protein
VVERFIYDPYGGSTTITNNGWTPLTGVTPGTDPCAWVYAFQGGRYDVNTGNYTFGARDYSPPLQRWTQIDPAGYPNGLNAYQFVNDNPINRSDASGGYLEGPDDSRNGSRSPDFSSGLGRLGGRYGTPDGGFNPEDIFGGGGSGSGFVDPGNELGGGGSGPGDAGDGSGFVSPGGGFGGPGGYFGIPGGAFAGPGAGPSALMGLPKSGSCSPGPESIFGITPAPWEKPYHHYPPSTGFNPFDPKNRLPPSELGTPPATDNRSPWPGFHIGHGGLRFAPNYNGGPGGTFSGDSPGGSLTGTIIEPVNPAKPRFDWPQASGQIHLPHGPTLRWNVGPNGGKLVIGGDF